MTRTDNALQLYAYHLVYLVLRQGFKVIFCNSGKVNGISHIDNISFSIRFRRYCGRETKQIKTKPQNKRKKENWH